MNTATNLFVIHLYEGGNLTRSGDDCLIKKVDIVSTFDLAGYPELARNQSTWYYVILSTSCALSTNSPPIHRQIYIVKSISCWQLAISATSELELMPKNLVPTKGELCRR